MALRIRQWIADSHRWSTRKHIAVAVALILTAGVTASFVFANDAKSAQNTTPGSTIPTTTPTTPPTTSTDHDDSTDHHRPAGDARSDGRSLPDHRRRADSARNTWARCPTTPRDDPGRTREPLRRLQPELFAVWIDADNDGCDTREEVLRSESLTGNDGQTSGCLPDPGSWFSAYDNTETDDPTQLDVDHLVSLKETWDSGAWAWTPERRIAYANDLTDGRTLVAVASTSNRSKGDRDPSNWLPDDDSVCQYVADWIAVKARWSMSMDESEHGRLRNLINDRCTGLTIEPWANAPA